MSERQRLGVQDALWLEMDRPTNLMVVDSLIWTATPVDWKRFGAVVQERMWDRYQVFRSVAVADEDGSWFWEERPRLGWRKHLERITLPAPADEAALREFIGAQRIVPLDRKRPLWKMFLIEDYMGGSAIVVRTHHAIADGIRMVQLAMSLFDASPEGGAILAPPVRLHAASAEAPEPEGRSVREQLTAGAVSVARELNELASDAVGRVGEVIGDPIGSTVEGVRAAGRAVGHAAAEAREASREVAGMALTNPVGAVHTAAARSAAAASAFAEWLTSALRPRIPGSGPLVDMFSAAPGDADIARKLLLGTRNDASIWTGMVGDRKAVAWSPPLPLAEVKAVARTHGATVNDVLVTSVAGTLHAYLEAHEAQCSSVNWMIPVNLKALDTTLPTELGNSFAIVQLELPTDIGDPLVVLDVVQRRMARIKSGHEAGIAFRIQEVISGFNKSLYQASVDLLANRAIGVLTNVPGPPIPVFVAGTKVEGMVGWAPLSGNQPMCFTIYSYNNMVFVGIACDMDLVPDHEQIVDGFAPAFHRLSVATH